MGCEAEVVSASGGVAQHEIEVEDCVVAALRFASSARGAAAASVLALMGLALVYASREVRLGAARSAA